MTTAPARLDSFGALDTLKVDGEVYRIARLDALERHGFGPLHRLPVSIRVLLEQLLRREDGQVVTREDIAALAAFGRGPAADREIPFLPARVVLQDFTGVPVLVDLAAMRDAAVALGGDPARVNPVIPVDLVIDHSVQVDFFGDDAAFHRNVAREYERNRERYAFLRWGQQAIARYRCVPPGTGIVHQVNLEYLAQVVRAEEQPDGRWAFPDTLVGTDSHTVMINGLGVLGWGVGGIEAEAAMLGQPLDLRIPEVVGVRLTGALPEGATATDAVLTVTELLRRVGVVDKFVEFFGPGVATLALADRATIANMAPEYGATMGFFPVDAETLRYLRLTGRDDRAVALVEAYCKVQGLFRTSETPDPDFSQVVTLDLSTVVPALAGPKLPQQRVPLPEVAARFRSALTHEAGTDGFGLDANAAERRVPLRADGLVAELTHGAVAIAAITSCTNTSNPSVLLGAGLLAKKAVDRGLKVPPWVKTSLAPGSRVVMDYLEAAGLLPALERLGFNLVGFGCTTCIGNSGPLPAPVAEAVKAGNLVVAGVLSGNRNFEGRINPLVRANYLASPPLVVAYALKGRVDRPLDTEPIGEDPDGNPVWLKDLWPTSAEIRAAMARAVRPEMFRSRYSTVFEGDEAWRGLPTPDGDRYAWERASTYIRRAPYFDDMEASPAAVTPITGARCLLVLGDSVTTDHISPAGDIPADGPAGTHLQGHGVAPRDFNSFGARRGNHEVMIRGTFANVRIRNRLAPGTEGGVTTHLPSGKRLSVFDAARRYAREGVPLVVLAGKEYGTGSSRDWAAKGPALLGVRAVLARSFERIHRSNLVGMGVLPCEFVEGASAESLGLTGQETFDLPLPTGGVTPRATLHVTATRPDGTRLRFDVRCRVDTGLEVEYLRHGGILPYVLRRLCGISGDGVAAPRRKPRAAPAKAKKRAPRAAAKKRGGKKPAASRRKSAKPAGRRPAKRRGPAPRPAAKTRPRPSKRRR